MIHSRFHRQVVALLSGLVMLFSLLPAPGAAAEEDLSGILQFNELQVSASPYYNTQGYDWFELKNTSRSARNLKGWSVVLNGKKVFTFSSGSIGAGEYLRVYCTEEPLKKNISTGFPLPAKGGTLCLYDAETTLISRVTWPSLPGNITYGLPGDEGAYQLLSAATPGKKNSAEGYSERSAAPVFETDPGFYSGTVSVVISSPENAAIHYTLDGSAPTPSSPLYTSPLTISETTVIRAIAKADDRLASVAVSATYFIGLDADFVIVSVICDPEDLYSSRGILVNGGNTTPNYMQDWEYPANIEYFDEQGACVINQSCGIKVAGGISRGKSQKSLAFFARSAYGDDLFRFNPFPHRDYDAVKSFVLRNGGSEGLADGLRFRDAMLTSLALDSHCLVTDARPVLVFINGKLWGHCNLRERANKYFIGALEGVSEKEIDSIDILTQDGIVSHGSNDDYKALSKFMKTHDLNIPENLSYVLDQLDIDSLFDCAAYQMAAGNMDLHNMRFYRVPGGKWKWMLYDLDTAMRHTGAQPIADFTKKVNETPSEKFDHIPFTTLMQVPEMRDRFLRRLAEILENFFTYDVLYTRTMEWHDALQPIIRYHCTRWTSLTPDGWEKNIRDKLLIMRQRPALIPEHIQKYFKLTDAETEAYFGEFIRRNAEMLTLYPD